MGRICPEDGTQLQRESVYGVEIDVCPGCGGVWFDDGELRALMQAAPDALQEVESRYVPSLEAAPHVGAKRCPVDGSTLEPFRYLYESPVTLDSCPTCYGVWVQEGELRAMANALEAEMTRAVNPQVMAMVEHQLAVAQLESEAEEREVRHRLFQRVMGVLRIKRPYVH